MAVAARLLHGDEPRPIVRAESTVDPLVVAGDASGVAAASSVGLLQGNPTILYAGTLDTHPGLRQTTLSHPAQLVVTDTNRKQGYRWNSLNENTGYTETAAQRPNTNDPSNAPSTSSRGHHPTPRPRPSSTASPR